MFHKSTNVGAKKKSGNKDFHAINLNLRRYFARIHLKQK